MVNVKDSKDFLVLSHLVGYVVEPLADSLCIVKEGGQIMQFGRDFLLNERVVNKVGEEFSEKTGYKLHENSTVEDMLSHFSEGVIADQSNVFWNGRNKEHFSFDQYRGLYLMLLKSNVDKQAEKHPQIYGELQDKFAKTFGVFEKSVLENPGEKE